MTINDFGGRVASVWERLRPATRSLIERVLQSATSAPPTRGVSASYDARSEWELSQLLAALDARKIEVGAVALSTEQARELVLVAEVCALVLHNEAQSAEVFAQLLERALRSRDFARVDALADTFSSRLAPSEICEMARHANPAVRAIAQESLTLMSTSILIELLSDPIDADVARLALECQAYEYGSEEARWIVSALERADANEENA